MRASVRYSRLDGSCAAHPVACILEFIPVLGTLVSGAICILLALTKGWVITVIVLVYFVVVHVIEDDVAGLRIVGKAIGVQALERKHPDLPMQSSHVLRHEFDYIRHGTLSWFINFDVVTGRVIEPSWGPTRTEEGALVHLQRLIASDPAAKKWHLILDILNIHQSESLVCWIAQREGIAQETLGVKGKSGILHAVLSLVFEAMLLAVELPVS